MSMPRIWLNGALVPADEAAIAPSDRGLLLADGLFETLLAREGRIIRLDRHITRLLEGAAVMQIKPPFESRTLRAAARETLEANGLANNDRASLRMTLTRGPAGRGVALPQDPSPTLMITAAAAPAPPAGLSVMVSSVSKLATSPASPLKTLNYTDNVMARMEADAAGADEALMRSADGGIACATIGNVFVVKEGSVTTPPDDGSIRAGITRNDTLALARDANLNVVEAGISVEALKAADEIFLTNSLWGICPVTTLEGTTLPAGPTTKKLAQALHEAWASDVV
ncbi:aminotransferase class IV [Pyruvatibacter sp. HU-CL02332]|uniref:aminotransferase class IV n=1 Tax=Pyruvatibacter sp. HU-CL02332 TaxID=3127650 RepID=UPI0031050731